MPRPLRSGDQVRLVHVPAHMSEDIRELVGQVGQVRYTSGDKVGRVGVVFRKLHRGGGGKSMSGCSGTILGVSLWFDHTCLRRVAGPDPVPPKVPPKAPRERR